MYFLRSNGAAGSYVDATTPAAAELVFPGTPEADWSVTLWLRYQGVAETGDRVFAIESSAGALPVAELRISEFGGLAFRLAGDEVDIEIPVGGGESVDGWTFIAITCDGYLGFDVYTNAVRYGEIHEGEVQSLYEPAGDTLTLFSTKAHGPGAICDILKFQLWNGELSGANVQALYDLGPYVEAPDALGEHYYIGPPEGDEVPDDGEDGNCPLELHGDAVMVQSFEIVSATATSPTSIDVTFSRDVDPDTAGIQAWSLELRSEIGSKPVVVDAVVVGEVVTLTTYGPMSPGAQYRITAIDVAPLDNNVTYASGLATVGPSAEPPPDVEGVTIPAGTTMTSVLGIVYELIDDLTFIDDGSDGIPDILWRAVEPGPDGNAAAGVKIAFNYLGITYLSDFDTGIYGGTSEAITDFADFTVSASFALSVPPGELDPLKALQRALGRQINKIAGVPHTFLKLPWTVHDAVMVVESTYRFSDAAAVSVAGSLRVKYGSKTDASLNDCEPQHIIDEVFPEGTRVTLLERFALPPDDVGTPLEPPPSEELEG